MSWEDRYPDVFAAVDRYDLGDYVVRCERCQKTHVWASVGECEPCSRADAEQDRRDRDLNEGRPGAH